MLDFLKEQALDYASFVSTMKHIMKERMGDEYDVRIYKVTKNNSLHLDCLLVLKNGRSFAPNIYLKPYYDSYMEGTPIQEIADRICCICQQNINPIVDENFTFSLEEMKSNIFYRLVSFERNLSLLNKIPHIRYLDLAITFHCLVHNDEDGIGTIRITNDHMKFWGITLEELKGFAVQNTKKLFPCTIRSMEEVLKGILSEQYEWKGEVSDFLDQDTVNIHSNNTAMYILSNVKGINGATCMLYQDVIRDFSNQIKTDLYILPSSIHEVILVPKEKNISKENLMEMVIDVNRTQVACDEVLSDKVYLYSREKDLIML